MISHALPKSVRAKLSSWSSGINFPAISEASGHAYGLTWTRVEVVNEACSDEKQMQERIQCHYSLEQPHTDSHTHTQKKKQRQPHTRLANFLGPVLT